MTSNHIFVLICFSVLLLVSACSSVGGDVPAGRNALQTGRANDAVGYLTRAADTDPNYKIPYRVPEGYWRTWGGRISKLAKTNKLGDFGKSGQSRWGRPVLASVSWGRVVKDRRARARS